MRVQEIEFVAEGRATSFETATMNSFPPKGENYSLRQPLLRKKNSKGLLFALILAALCINSCKNEAVSEEGPQRFVEIFVRYLTPENEYKAQVMFMEGDSLGVAQPKKTPGGLTWGGSSMREKSVSSNLFRYEMIQPGPYKARHRFEFMDEKGARRAITAEMSPVTSFRIGPSISRNADAKLIIEGKPLEAGETLLLLFTNEQGITEPVTFSGPSATNTFTIKREALSALKPGSHELYLIKQQQRESRQHQRIVFSTIEWYSPVEEVQIVE